MKFLKALFSTKPVAANPVDRGYRDREWMSWKPKEGPPSAPDGFVKLNGATEVAVAGTSYRLEESRVFLSALNGARAVADSIKLVRQFDNSEHEGAVAVFGMMGHREVHIGYLPADVSDMIKTKYLDEMPLKAGLKEWGKKNSGEAIFFRLTLFVPNAKDRKKFERA